MHLTRLLIAAVSALALAVCAADAPVEKPGAVDYKKLGYENEKFTHEGKLFTGVAVRKDKQGRIRAQYEYRDGVHDGLVEEWYTNGVRSVQTPFVAGQRHGTNIYWNVDGSLLKRQVWREGKLVESTDPHDLEKPATP